jgi:hypothetical protein
VCVCVCVCGWQVLTLITIITGFVYPTVWVLGEEGLEAFDINVETGVTVMSDLVGKVRALVWGVFVGLGGVWGCVGGCVAVALCLYACLV